MNHITCHYFFLLYFAFLNETIAECRWGHYLNLCDFNANEYNNSNIDEGTECDCQKFIYCSVLETSAACNLTAVELSDIEKNLTSKNDLHCELLPLEQQVEIHDFEPVNVTVGGSDSVFNKYLIVCSQTDTYHELNNKWEVTTLTPPEVLLGSDVEMQLSVVKSSGSNSTYTWCIVKTPDNDTEILSATWISETQVNCSEFQPKVSGLFVVSLTSKNLNFNLDQNVSLKVIPKHPVADHAEYSSDLQTINIYFDENIEMHSSCATVFSEESQEHLGNGFICSTKGNILVVKIGSDFKFINTIEITRNNQIFSAGALDTDYSALPAKLTVSEKRVLEPNLSFYFVNTLCEANTTEKYLSLKVVSLESLKSLSSYQAFKNENGGKRHRKNLIVWRTIRRIQSKLSSLLINFQINDPDVVPVIENLVSFEKFLEAENNTSGFKMSAAVSVVIQSPPSTPVLVAEASVSFCNNSKKLFHHKWLVNDEIMEEDGKLLIAENLPPGRYLVRCLLVAHDSTEILGEGWAITELLDWPEKVIIFPTEIAVGATDDILLRAVTRHGKQIHWACRTFLDEPCFTRGQRLVSDVLNFNSPNVYIPAGTLPVGNYVWSVENANEPNGAKVFIKAGNITAIDVKTTSPFFSSSEEIIINSTVPKLHPGCRAWWSGVREKGFDYINLHSIGVREEVTVEEHEKDIPLVIPTSSGELGGLDSDFSYMFKLQIVCSDSGSLAHVTVPVSVNNPPRLSPLMVEPTTGKALVTNFSIFELEAEDSSEDYPLSFEWSYIDPCDVKIPISLGASHRRVNTYLPPGDLRLILKVCDVRRACSEASSQTISVSRSPDIPQENFNYVRDQIRFLMASGDVTEAFGLITTVFKSLDLASDAKTRAAVFSTVEEAIKSRVEFLTNKTNNSKLEFLELAFGVAKYFRKGSNFLEYLTNVKNTLATSERARRSTDSEDTPTESIFKLHSITLDKNDTIQNRMELMKDVRKFMLKVCADPTTNSVLIDSPIVKISIRKIIPEKESNKTFSFPPERKFELRVKGKFLKQNACLCMAQFSRDLLGNTKESRLTPVCEVQIVRNGKFIKTAKSETTVLTMTFFFPDPPSSGTDCMMWTKTSGWSLKCFFVGATDNGIVCRCKDFGYFSAFLRNPKPSKTTGVSTSPPTSFGSRATVVLSEWDSCIAFKITEDFFSTVGNDSKAFTDDLRRQITKQLKIPQEAISYLFIKPGSIQVTVFFVDVHDTKAEAVVKDLVNLLHNGNLLLTSPNNSRLTIDRSDLKIMVSPPRNKERTRMRFVAYAVLAGTILIILAIFSTVVILRKKAKRVPVGAADFSPEHTPKYLRFYDEFSVEGSSESLAVYRRNPLRAESW